MKITGQIQTGIGKKECEDSALIFCDEFKNVLHDGKYEFYASGRSIVAIADGVGGNLGARDASSFVLSELLKKFSVPKAPFTENFIRAAVTEINYELVEFSSNMGPKNLMATTFTAVFFDREKIIMAHAGNTRLSSMGNRCIHQHNTDHSTYQFLLDTGNLEAAEQCNKSEIYSFLGGGNVGGMRRLEIKTIQPEKLLNCLLLTSDGVHEFVDPNFIENIFSNVNISDTERSNKLISNALENYSCDDKTVLIVRI